MPPIQIKSNRLFYLIPIPICIGLMYAFYWALFESPDSANHPAMLRVIAVFVFLVGTFLIVMSVKTLLRPPVLFELNDEGVILNEGGVSSGLIRWSEIRAVEETTVPTARRGQLQPVLALYLKEGLARKQRYNAVLQSLANLSESVTGTSFFITPALLGKQYEPVKALILQRITPSAPADTDPVSAFESKAAADEAEEASGHWALRYFRELYGVRTGKRKAGWAVYSFYFVVVAAAVHDFLLDAPLGTELLFVVIGAFVLLFFYAAWQSRPRAAEKNGPAS